MKHSTGYTRKNPDGTWRARITFTDRLTGKRVNWARGFPPSKGIPTKSEAEDLLAEQRKRIRKAPAKQSARTWLDLAAIYKADYAIPPEWKAGTLIEGMRAFRTARQRVDVLSEYMGSLRLSDITTAVLWNVRAKLMQRPTAHKARSKTTRLGKPWAIATVNRAMSLARAMLYVAEERGWIAESPFRHVDRRRPLITIKDEEPRERIITAAEEERILAAASKPHRLHVRPLIIVALDTGARFGELVKMRWKDVDFRKGILRIIKSHTKTQKARQVGMTERAREELRRLFQMSEGDREAPVFGVKNVNTAWRSIRREAGLEETVLDSDGSVEVSRVRWHDFRHTQITRAIGEGVEASLAGKLAGHSEPRTTARYNNPDEASARRVARVLDRSRAKMARKRLIAAAARVMRRKQKGEAVN